MRAWAGIIIVATLPALASPIYRHVDADGNVVYSDEPKTGQRTDLKPITVFDPSDAETSASLPALSSTGPDTPAFEYSRFEISDPRNEQTLPTGQAGNVQVQLAIEPSLQHDDRVQLRVDGEVRQSPRHTDVFALGHLERGEHHLQAELLDAQGQVRLTTAPVTLHVQRASIHLPANPNNSRFPHSSR